MAIGLKNTEENWVALEIGKFGMYVGLLKAQTPSYDDCTFLIWIQSCFVSYTGCVGKNTQMNILWLFQK